ncbi:MAG: hypothetical protein IKS48_00490 [Eubacterium sp.]|nr:hypothetical protein [Eubacterium sp.]
MCFKEMLKRYHISPLQYADGEELSERDYFSLFTILQKYYTIKSMNDEKFNIPFVDKALIDKVSRNKEKSLIPLSDEECMDILMKQNIKEVL